LGTTSIDMKRLLFWRKKKTEIRVKKTADRTSCYRCNSSRDKRLIKVRKIGTDTNRTYCDSCLRIEISEGGIFEILY